VTIGKLLKQKVQTLSEAAQRFATVATRNALSVARWRVPYYSRLGLYPQALFVVGALIWFEYKPEWGVEGPGVAMAFVALAATYMAARGSESTRIEGAVWIAITFAMFVVEMHFLGVERRTRDAEQAALRTREELTRKDQNQSFTQLIREGEVLFKSLAEEKALTAKNLEHITGGTGYCWLVPLHPLPVGLGGNPAYQGNNWWQLGLKSSAKVVLPTCDLHFVPFPTGEEEKTGVMPSPPDIFYHFEKVPIILRRYYRYTENYMKGDRIYSGTITTPTRSFIEVIKFAPDPKDPTRYVPSCLVAELAGKTLENDCNPQ
jgi:hypothetical protein